jgi:hypothetical protein
VTDRPVTLHIEAPIYRYMVTKGDRDGKSLKSTSTCRLKSANQLSKDMNVARQSLLDEIIMVNNILCQSVSTSVVSYLHVESV